MSDEKHRRITYDVDAATPPPTADTLLVSMRRDHTPSRVYLVLSARPVRSSKYAHRYALRVLRADDLRPLLEQRGDQFFLRGQRVYTLYWYSRHHKPLSL